LRGRSLKPESRSPLLERADDEDGHQRRDAEAEDQERQLLAFAFALQEARFGVRGVHDDASLPQAAARDNGPTVGGTGVTCLKFRTAVVGLKPG
jgi:hypothetical protein